MRRAVIIGMLAWGIGLRSLYAQGFAPAGGVPPVEAGPAAAPPAAESKPGSEASPAGNPLETYTWRYERTSVSGVDIVRRIKMTWDMGQTWDAQKMDQYRQDASMGKIPAPAGSDPNAVAAWKLYYEQMKLWEEYVKMSCFGGVDLKGTLSEITWARGGAAVGGGPGGAGIAGSGGMAGGGAEAIVAKNQNKSLDQQTGEFFTVSGGGGPQQQGGGPPITKQEILKQVDSLTEILKLQAIETDEKVYNANQKLYSGLQTRKGAREAYKNWLQDQKDLVVSAALDWGKRQQGQVVIVDGVQYELYSPSLGLPQGEGPIDTVRVVSENLTPYDILNADGSLRKPSGR